MSIVPKVLQNLRKYWACQTDDDCLDIPLTEVNQLNMNMESPIHIAAWKGTPTDVQWLIDNGADINQRGDFEMTPLHYAYRGGKFENVAVLIKAGADQTLRSDLGMLPGEDHPHVKWYDERKGSSTSGGDGSETTSPSKKLL